MKKTTHKPGFTLIELTLSLGFISVLLVTITMITLSIITIYQKGLAIRAVNATGRELIDEFSRSIGAAPALSTTNLCSSAGFSGTLSTGEYGRCYNDGAYLLTFQQYTGSSFQLKGQTISDPIKYGAFCTGRSSYIWNTGYALNGYGGNRPTYLVYYTRNASNGILTQHRYPENPDSTDSEDFFRLIKVSDPSRSVCSGILNGKYSTGTAKDHFELSASYPLDEGSVPNDLLDSSEDNLALYDFQIFRRTRHAVTAQSYYSGSFLLATLRGEINITGQGDYCTDEPDNLDTDFAYCALNKFNFAMRATGDTNDQEKIQNQ